MEEIEAHVRCVVRDITDPTGRTMYVLFDRAMSDNDMRNWHDRVNDLHPASPLGAVMEVPEVRALVDVLTSIKSTWILPSAIQLALDAALAPFTRKGE